MMLSQGSQHTNKEEPGTVQDINWKYSGFSLFLQQIGNLARTGALFYDSAVDIGVNEFCQDCKICAESCPSGAVPMEGKRL